METLSARESAFHPEKQLKLLGGGDFITPPGLSHYSNRALAVALGGTFSSSPQIGSPRFIRVETRVVAVLVSGLHCQPCGYTRMFVT